MVKENDLGEILAQELERIKECGGRINLAEIERRTGIGRSEYTSPRNAGQASGAGECLSGTAGKDGS